MSRTEVFERLLASMHEAVLDEAQWPGAAALIDELCGSRGNSLVYGDDAGGGDIDLFFTRSCAGGEIYDEQRARVLRGLPRRRRAPAASAAAAGQPGGAGHVAADRGADADLPGLQRDAADDRAVQRPARAPRRAGRRADSVDVLRSRSRPTAGRRRRSGC